MVIQHGRGAVRKGVAAGVLAVVITGVAGCTHRTLKGAPAPSESLPDADPGPKPVQDTDHSEHTVLQPDWSHPKRFLLISELPRRGDQRVILSGGDAAGTLAKFKPMCGVDESNVYCEK